MIRSAAWFTGCAWLQKNPPHAAAGDGRAMLAAAPANAAATPIVFQCLFI
jgi:hypothetical protein